MVHNAIRKYGKENCKIKTLLVANDIGYLKDVEIKAIAEIKTQHPDGYNCGKGGDGVDFTEDLRKRISNSRRKWWSNKENRKSLLNKINSAEVKDRKRSARKKLLESDEYIKRLPEIKRKMSESSNKRWQDEGARKKISDLMTNRWQDPAFKDMMRKKFSEARKKQWQDPNYRELTIKKIAASKIEKRLSNAI